MKKNFKKILIINIALIFSIVSLYSQDLSITFQYITKKDGLSHGNIHYIYKDSHGFIWFCTENGLDRYDGYSIKHYRHDPENENSLSINFVTCICEDRDGILWVGTKFGGLNRFDPVKEKFSRYNVYTATKGAFWQTNQYNWVTALIPCKAGGMWVGTRSGLFRMMPNSKKVSWADDSLIIQIDNAKLVHYKFDSENQNGLHFRFIYCLYEDRSGNLWIGFDRGKFIENKIPNFEPGAIQKLEPGKNFEYPPIYITYKYNPDKPEIPVPKYLMSIYEDRNGFLWLGSWGDGLIRFDPVKNIFLPIKNIPKTRLGLTDIYEIKEDLRGNLWVASYGNGLFKFPASELNKSDPSFIQYTHSDKQENGLSNNYIRSLFMDSSGILWIGTLGGGINKLLPENNFERYYSNPKNPNSLAIPNVTALYEDKNRIIWIGTNDYLNRFDPESKKFSKYRLIKGRNEIFIRSITEDNYGNLLIGTNQGIYKFDYEKRLFTEAFYEYRIPDTLKNREARVYKNFNLYFIYRNLVFRVEGHNLKLVMQEELGYPANLEMIECINRKIWVGIEYTGLFQFDTAYKILKKYSYVMIHNTKPYSGSFYYFFNIKEYNENTIFCGTREGIIKIIHDKDIIEKITEVDGLSNNYVYAMEIDKNGYFWISTQYGLSGYNPITSQFVNYYSIDGLHGNEFNPGVSLKTLEGKLYFGGKDGFTSFLPAEIKINKYIPPVVITNLMIFNKPVNVNESVNGKTILTTDIAYTEEIELFYNMNILSFEFAALDYNSPSENKYAYKMDGIDPDWVYVNSGRRFANYSGIQPGQYVFHVKACNKFGIWNEKGISIKINILFPFWDTAWFRILTLSAVLFFIVLFYKIRTKKIRERNLYLNEINTSLNISKEKYKALADHTFDWEFWSSADAKFIYVSPSVERITGYPADNFYNDPHFINKIIHPDDFKEWENHTYKSSQQQYLEFRILTKDNKIKWLGNTKRSIYDSEGKYLGIRGSNRDITESVMEREEILRLAAIIEQSVETIMILDIQKTVIFINEAFLKRFCFSENDILGKDLSQLNIFNYPGPEIINEIFSRKSAWTGKTNRTSKDSKDIIESTIISPIFNKDGKIINYVIIGKDISHEEELEKQLRQSQKMEAIGTLAGGIAHDFNNILTSILGNTELLGRQLPKEGNQRKYFDRILTGVKRASSLANQILAFSRKKEIEKEIIQIGPIVKEALKLLRASVPSTIEINLSIQDELGNISGDPVQIHQIIMNLVTNAKHAIGEKSGLISINITEENIDKRDTKKDLLPGHYIKIVVSDTGRGINSENIDRIFEPYFTTKETGEGTGLGLAVVHGIVKSHKGEIFVDSKVGEGTTFTIYLPIVISLTNEKDKIDDTIPGGNETILVVDDEGLVVEVLSEILSDFGYKVIVCTNSLEALEMFKVEPDKFDLLITDMTMPKMVGTELSREIKKIRKDIPIIISTGYSEILDNTNLATFGINDLLRKPLDSIILLKTVRRLLDDNKMEN